MSAGIDRREFIRAAAGTATVVLVPVPSLVAAGPVETAVTGPALLSDWTIDDMFGVYPRYADAIGYGKPEAETLEVRDPFEALGFA